MENSHQGVLEYHCMSEKSCMKLFVAQEEALLKSALVVAQESLGVELERSGLTRPL